ncbi:N-acetylmuramoyl-L-alanine amidase [Flavobacterium sp. K5-23]|nr:N-acetylmuramoyl-L-alanine amidase [Flavobacterium sp. K5-23]
MSINTLLLITVLFLSFNVSSQSKQNFVIILDAGHGGKDPGNSYHGFVEKQIALKTTLKVEEFLKKDKDIKVVFTRKSDVFIELADRPKLANSIHADLFISIHCNSVKNGSPYGTETFVMGLTRSNTNLEIAKNENSVILLEKDYKKTYKGFDPNKPETLIGLKILQEEYLNRSIKLASRIENNFTHKLNRKSRGIKQTPLWVLDAAYMPSVLIELGFLSNKVEGAYLNSDAGQNNMAEAIANAIISYKKNYLGESVSNKNTEKSREKVVDKYTKDSSKVLKKETVAGRQLDMNEENQTESSEVVFKVQIAAANKSVKLIPANFKGLKDVSVITDNGSLFKYLYGSTSDYKEAKQNLEVAKSKGYSSAYLIAYKNGEKISIQQAIK